MARESTKAMTTSRTRRSRWAVPATIGLVTAGASGAVVWAAVVPPPAFGTASSAPVSPSHPMLVISRDQQDAVDTAARKLHHVRHRLRALLHQPLPTIPATSGGSPRATTQVGSTNPQPAPVYVAPAPPPVQTTTGASGATH